MLPSSKHMIMNPLKIFILPIDSNAFVTHPINFLSSFFAYIQKYISTLEMKLIKLMAWALHMYVLKCIWNYLHQRHNISTLYFIIPNTPVV